MFAMPFGITQSFVPHPTLEDKRRPLPSWGEAKKERAKWKRDGMNSVLLYTKEPERSLLGYSPLASSQRSASMAAMQPVPAAVTAWR